MRRRLLLLTLGLAPALAAPTPAAAQQEVYVVRTAPAWLGISYDARWVLEGDHCAAQVLVDRVIQGSPAERAGLRAGDAIVAVDGEPVPPGRLQALAARLVPGDSVRLRFLRDGATHEVTAVADRRPDRPMDILLERSTGLRSAGTPVIEVAGNRLVGRNAAEWDPGRARGYWLQHENGRTEYRVVRHGSTDELDQRVARLLACADSMRFEAPPWPGSSSGARITLRAVQERADSLRVVMSRRALERIDSLRIDTIRGGQPGTVRLFQGPTAGTVRLSSPEGSYTFRVDEHLAVGLRGIAGAELTALDPELADYFRNADRGLLVLRIAPDTPADRAGLRPGDVVTAADGRRLDSVAELRRIIALPQAGDVELRVVRRGRTLELTLPRD